MHTQCNAHPDAVGLQLLLLLLLLAACVLCVTRERSLTVRSL